MAEAITQQYRQKLTVNPKYLGRIRRTAAAYVQGWGWGELVDPAVVCVMEMLANVYQHAGSSVCSLLIQPLPSGIRIVVSDSSRQLPVVREPDWRSESGRGMYILSRTADEWGAALTDTGKDVWVEIRGVGSCVNSASVLPPGHADNSVDVMARVLGKLRDSFVETDLDDALEAVLGAAAGPTGIAGSCRRPPRRPRLLGRLAALLPRRTAEAPSGAVAEMFRSADHLSRMLGQLVAIAQQRSGGAPESGLAEAISRADRLRARQVCEGNVEQAHLRRLAMVTLDLLEQLAGGDDEPLPTFGSANAGQRRRSA
ncbi:ATP-binding protein [Streptomyces pinistramenti]|uniref:ATP-binding protein n=1 Tax=Streptomyces pinistramenti TaxID=2884812 RepID=UPI001D08F4C6|nr:ATP-binding protein [Streptomyces pinistramenti]MCB5911060.1 ATP-binding protein [Streptomyces pinistramenti]